MNNPVTCIKRAVLAVKSLESLDARLRQVEREIRDKTHSSLAGSISERIEQSVFSRLGDVEAAQREQLIELHDGIHACAQNVAGVQQRLSELERETHDPIPELVRNFIKRLETLEKKSGKTARVNRGSK